MLGAGGHYYACAKINGKQKGRAPKSRWSTPNLSPCRFSTGGLSNNPLNDSLTLTPGDAATCRVEEPCQGIESASAPAKSSRILLVNPNRYDQPYPVYPVGLAYLNGALRSAGYPTAIWDRLAAADTLEQRIATFRPDFVALSMRNVDNVQYHNPSSFVGDLLDCCRRIRAATRARLIIGGSGFSIFPREILELTGADFGIQGEGEGALVRLLGTLETGASTEGIPGLVHRNAEGTIHISPPESRAGLLDSAPDHEPDLLRAYTSRGSIPGIQTQRGCPLKCCYCTYPIIEGKRSRYRPAREVVREMADLAKLGTKYTFIVDSVFNTHEDHVLRICEALAKANLDMEWQSFLRPHKVTRDLLTAMRRAGCRHIEFGSDSLSDPVLGRYGKGFSFEEIEEASRYAHELGIKYSHFLIFGGPGETADTLEETLARTQRLPEAFFFATLGMRVYPGTPLWRELEPTRDGDSASDYLVTPRFHMEPHFTVGGLYERLRRHRERNHNWVVGDPPPEFLATMGRLRERGVRGPMWEYIETLQRMAARQAGS